MVLPATLRLAQQNPIPACSTQSTAKSRKKILVGGHPWVYAATQPGYDVYPILERIFSDLKYAGIAVLELMHTALRPDGWSITCCGRRSRRSWRPGPAPRSR